VQILSRAGLTLEARILTPLEMTETVGVIRKASRGLEILTDRFILHSVA
jgi:hypothetical protein